MAGLIERDSLEQRSPSEGRPAGTGWKGRGQVGQQARAGSHRQASVILASQEAGERPHHVDSGVEVHQIAGGPSAPAHAATPASSGRTIRASSFGADQFTVWPTPGTWTRRAFGNPRTTSSAQA